MPADTTVGQENTKSVTIKEISPVAAEWTAISHVGGRRTSLNITTIYQLNQTNQTILQAVLELLFSNSSSG